MCTPMPGSKVKEGFESSGGYECFCLKREAIIMGENPRGRTSKVVCNIWPICKILQKKSGRLLGAQALGPHPQHHTHANIQARSQRDSSPPPKYTL